VDRHDIATLLERKPHAGMDMLTVLGRQFHASQQLVRVRANRNPNDVIEEDMTFGERIADRVAAFGGSWPFLITFGATIIGYTAINVVLRGQAWDPYPFILLNLAFSTQAAYAAPLILLAGNRASIRDRMTLEHAAAEADIEDEQNVRLLTGNTEILKQVAALEQRILDLEKSILAAIERGGGAAPS